MQGRTRLRFAVETVKPMICVVKIFGENTDDQHRYSPATALRAKGNPSWAILIQRKFPRAILKD